MANSKKSGDCFFVLSSLANLVISLSENV